MSNVCLSSNVSSNDLMSNGCLPAIPIDIHKIDSKPIVQCLINGTCINLEFDSGSSLTVVSQSAVTESGLKIDLVPSSRSLRVANGQIKGVKGCATVDVEVNNVTIHNLILYVVERYFPSLFGLSWINQFCGEDWLHKALPSVTQTVSSACSVESGVKPMIQGKGHDQASVKAESLKLKKNHRTIEELMKSEVFKPGLGTVKGVEARLVLKDEVKPVMMKARHLPYALRKKVEDQLNSMEASGSLQKIDDSPWGTPVVPVRKGDEVRLCGDYKSTLNKNLCTRQYPIPSLEDCLNSVAGGTRFSVIDIKQAYNNLMIRPEDRILTTLNTHKGLYMWLRLPYGISSAAAIFQSVMDDTLRGIPMVCCRIDDILVSGKDEEDHLANLNVVIERLEKRGFRCKYEKSQINQKEVVYNGHRVSAEGIRPIASKVESLQKSPEPKNVSELISFLGAANYYRRYLPNLSTIIKPLDELRGKNVKWRWTEVEQKAYDQLKKLLCSDRVLTLYNPELPLKLDTDASSTGVGAVLSHVLLNGEERPVEYISRT